MSAITSEERHTVLLCDDNSLNRKLIAAFLTGLPYRIIECSNGRDCISAALDTRNRVDLILLDISLKDINGVEVCRAIREGLKDRQATLPIIAYTAHAMDEERSHYLENGFSDVLTKPVMRDDLLGILKKFMG